MIDNKFIIEAYRLQEEINEKKTKLAQLKEQIANEAVFEPNCATCTQYFDNGCIRVKTSNRKVYKWDQKKLEEARKQMGNQEFLKVFKYEFSTISSRKLDAFLGFAPQDQKDLVTNAAEVKTYRLVTIERVKDGI